jgi:hypothetical protein
MKTAHILKLAFDKSSRHIDADGRLHVMRSHISKAMVSPYYGREIPEFESLGLVADQVYRLLRDPVELERGAETFARLPVLSQHVPVTVDTMEQDEDQKKLVVGSIGSDVSFNPPYLDADLCIWDSKAIAGIDSDQVRELSCAYRYVPVMESGVFEGEPYDGRMTEIRGNHLALVEVGRAGPDVVVSDHNPFKTKETAMKMSKLGRALFVTLSAFSPVLAADSAMPALVGAANKKTFNKADIKAKLIALDSDMDPEQLDNVIDALLDVEQDPKPMEPAAPAVDEAPVDKLRSLLAGKVDDATMDAACALMAPAPAADSPSGLEVTDKGSVNGHAMDAALGKFKTEFRQAEEAKRDVRSIVGDVIGMDSAAEVYKFALDHMKVDCTDINDALALRALFRVASENKLAAKPPKLAHDSAGLEKAFPNAVRFGQ